MENNLTCPACMQISSFERAIGPFDFIKYKCSNCNIILSDAYIEAWNEGFNRGKMENQYNNVGDLD